MRDGKLNVMQVVANLDIGGAQETARTLVEHLRERDCAPVVCTFRDGPLRQAIEALGVPVEVLPRRRHGVVALPLFVLDMLHIRRALVGVVAKHAVRVVQTQSLHNLDFLVATLRLGPNPPLVFWTIQNASFELREDQLPRHKWLLGPKRLTSRLLYRLAQRWVDGFIAVSDEVARAVMHTIRPAPGKVTVICNSVDVRRYQRQVDRASIRRRIGVPEHAQVMAVVATLKPQKGHRYLIDAVSSIVPRLPSLHVLIIGDGELRQELRAQVRAAGLDEQVHFLGSRDDVPDLLAASDFFVLPSLWEGLSLALLEAMSSGLPVVATAVSGTSQVITPGVTGLLVPPGDSRQLAEAIVRLLSEPDRGRAMGAAARDSVRASFGAVRQAEEHLALYRMRLGVASSARLRNAGAVGR